MKCARIPMNELFFCLDTILQHRYASVCYEMILHYMEMTIRQLERIWDPASLKRLFANLDHSRFKTIGDGLKHGFDVNLHIREIHFMLVCIVNCRRFLLGGGVEEIIRQSSLSQKDNLLDELNNIREELKKLKYKEARDYFEHYDEKIELNKNDRKKSELIASKKSENLQFAKFDPREGILEIQNVGERIQKIDISKPTVNGFSNQVCTFLKNLYLTCENDLSPQQKVFLQKIRIMGCVS